MERELELTSGGDSLEMRIDLGRRCLEIVNPQEEDETAATDAISDILTAVIGPAGVTYWREDSDEVGRVVLDSRATAAAENLLDAALRSWEGDAEDYVTPPDEPEVKKQKRPAGPVVVVIRDPDAANEYAVFGGPVQTYDIDAGYVDVRDEQEGAEWARNHREAAAEFERDGYPEVAELIRRVVDSYRED